MKNLKKFKSKQILQNAAKLLISK